MTDSEVLCRLIGPNTTLNDVVAVFSGSGWFEGRWYTWTSTAELRGEVIAIEGTIQSGVQTIGRFSRRIVYEQKAARAIHEIIEIDDEGDHRDRGIAMAHYRSAIQFYDRVGIRSISLVATAMGIFVWPTFGFDLSSIVQRERLLALLKKAGVEAEDLTTESVLAPQVVDIVLDGDDVGSQVLIRLMELEFAHEVPMILDLANPVQRLYLEKRGILLAGD